MNKKCDNEQREEKEQQKCKFNINDRKKGGKIFSLEIQNLLKVPRNLSKKKA